jgi:AbrB family looped-hinge helix DNA binding protein
MNTNAGQKVRVGRQGRIVIPAPLREEMGLSSGEELIGRVKDGRLVLERREDVVRRLRSRFNRVPAERVLSEELISERREAAAREAEREAAEREAAEREAAEREAAEREARSAAGGPV